MAYTPITGAPSQYLTEDNTLASGYYLKFYQANTTTPLSVATDDTGGTLLAKVKLNARGMPISNPLDDDTVFIPHVDQSYRIVLYKTEADADADNTANSDFNIPDVAPDIAPSGDAADIILRSTTVEAQDDYDRSPLFVDGTDFTAGAGPHTITVPASWDPTGSDFRLYRLDASDIVTALSPTATTSTTFTIAETLLSTDVLFIGDDEFRNQMDGDPADIRNRLDVYKKSEAQAAPTAVSGFTSSTSVYVTDGTPVGSLDVDASANPETLTTVGPTGSGADIIWSTLDALPSTTNYVELNVNLSHRFATLTTDLAVLFEVNGSLALRSRVENTNNQQETISMTGSVKASLNASNVFSLEYYGTPLGGSSGDFSVSLGVIGFGV